jgi:hypothetical protein
MQVVVEYIIAVFYSLLLRIVMMDKIKHFVLVCLPYMLSCLGYHVLSRQGGFSQPLCALCFHKEKDIWHTGWNYND